MHHAIQRVGFIGLGRMGTPMAHNLLRAGYSLKVFDILPASVADLVAGGAAPASSPADAARDVDAVLTMVLDDAVLEQVALADDGILRAARPGTIYADMSTVSPVASARVAQAAAVADVPYLRAKVSGSVKPATDGTLTIFVSGPKDAYTACGDLFHTLGKELYYVGPGDEAVYLKLVLSLIVGGTATLLGEALAFGERGGVDWQQMIDILTAGPLGSTFLRYKAPLLLARDFATPQSTVDVAAKDIDLALTAARAMHHPLPLTALSRELFRVLQANGDGTLDFIAVVRLFETLAGLDRRESSAQETP